tara:strand:- start:4412 stop:5446 length:1035 start_codon:yes stop_codon:yes gene_type:complete
MKKILLVATIYRVGERIYPIIPKLSKKFNIDVLKTAQMGKGINWYGDNDLRAIFDKKYKKYIKNIYYELPNLSDYDLIIFDDDRPRNGLKQIYQKAKTLNILTIGNFHGNKEFCSKNLNNQLNRCWDKIQLFGYKDYQKHVESGVGSKENFLVGGIPCNDSLKKYERTDENILVIVNFLGNRTAPFNRFDENTFRSLGLLDLQKEFNKKVVVKLKSRADHPDSQSDFNYLDNILPKNLDYEVIMDVEDDNKMMSDSFIVISAPSTLAFKSVQKGIPTVLLDGYGQIGNFYDFKGVVDLDTQKIFDEIERQYNKGRDEKFIRNTIDGGIDFTSTEKYINNIKDIV